MAEGFNDTDPSQTGLWSLRSSTAAASAADDLDERGTRHPDRLRAGRRLDRVPRATPQAAPASSLPTPTERTHARSATSRSTRATGRRTAVRSLSRAAPGCTRSTSRRARRRPSSSPRARMRATSGTRGGRPTAPGSCSPGWSTSAAARPEPIYSRCAPTARMSSRSRTVPDDDYPADWGTYPLVN